MPNSPSFTLCATIAPPITAIAATAASSPLPHTLCRLLSHPRSHQSIDIAPHAVCRIPPHTTSPMPPSLPVELEFSSAAPPKIALASQTPDILGDCQSGKDVRTQNVMACQVITNIVKSLLGPVGLNKVEKLGKDSLMNCAKTSMSSKLIVTDDDFFAKLIV